MDEESKKRAQAALDIMSMEELQEMIEDLKGQIEVAEEMIEKKKSATSAAHSVFKS